MPDISGYCVAIVKGNSVSLKLVQAFPKFGLVILENRHTHRAFTLAQSLFEMKMDLEK